MHVRHNGMRPGRALVLLLALLTASVLISCSRPAAPRPAAVPPPPTPSAAAEEPAAQNAHLLLADPTGRYIAEVHDHLRILDYNGQVLTTPDLPGDPVQDLFWSPRGDQLVAVTGKPVSDCCGLVQDARCWLVPVPFGAPRELVGLPQEVVYNWASDEKSLYVLDNWRRITRDMNALGERIQRYDLATGQLTLLLGRQPQLFSADELPGGDLLVGQYAGGGHAFYYRLPAGGEKLVAAAPFHMWLSPDKRWAVEGNLNNHPELAIAEVRTGTVTKYQPKPAWPPLTETTRMSDPVWAPDSRWLIYTITGDLQELRFVDRTQAEGDRVIPNADGAWLPGPGPQALVFRQEEGGLTLWRYDVGQASFVGPAGPKAPNATFCGAKVSHQGNTVAYLTCSGGNRTVWLVDLSGGSPPQNASADQDTRILSLSADGKTAALEAGGRSLKLIKLGP